jgi:hypothetical protein
MRYDIATGVRRAKTRTQKAIMGLTAPVFVAAIALSGGAALAATTYSLFGDAEIVSPGNASPHAAQIRSVDGGGFGGVRFNSSTVTNLNSLNNLATDTNYTENSCGGGSPRFQVRVTDGVNTGNIFVYLGPPPSYTLCPMNVWIPGTNLVTPASLVDTSQLPLGTFYDPYSAAQSKYGHYTVTGITVVADGEWAFPSGNQTVLVDNVQINADTVTFDQPQNKDECKHGGWMHLEREDGTTFKNQGDCIQYVNTGR